MTDPESAITRPRGRFPVWVLSAAALGLVGVAVGVWAALRPPSPSPDSPKTTDKQAPPVEKSKGPALFQEMTAASGIDFTYRTGVEAGQFTILETLGGGVGIIDYDGDGRFDIFLTGGGGFEGQSRTDIRGLPCRLYRNLGDWKFKDVTSEVGLDRIWWYTHGVAVADYDRDGWPDMLVTGYGKVALFRNVPGASGGRVFQDVTQDVGLQDSLWSTSAAWADTDGDGYPEVYVCHYLDWSFANNPVCKGQVPEVERDVCAPQRFKPQIHSLFRNEAGKRFRDVASEQGFKAAGCGLGVVAADVNDDGRPDFYVGNDATANFLFLNRGGGRMEERGHTAGVALDDAGHYNGSMGVDIGDFDGTGKPAIWVTNFQGDQHALYRNIGKELFYHHTRLAGINAIGMHWVGFGTAFIDIENDGWQDLAIVNGHVLHNPALGSPFKQRPVLLRNERHASGRGFTEISAQGGSFFETPALGRGLAVADLDNDGWPDLVVSHSNSPVALLRNEAKSTSPNTWLGISLRGQGQRDVTGSTIIVEVAGSRLTRFAKNGGSYLSSSDPRLLFGLANSKTIDRVTVKWAWGQTQTWAGLDVGSYWQLSEGNEKADRLDYPAAK